MKLTITLCFLFSWLPLHAQKEVAKNEKAAIQFHNLFNADTTKGVACYRIPSLIRAINGDLIAAIDERVPSCGDLKWSKDINIVIRRSQDDGQSWSEIESIVDYPFGQSASDPSMILDKTTGTIFLFFNYMDLEHEKDVYYLKVITSKDNGISWSAPIDISTQISKPDWKNDFKFITSGRGIQTRSGKLIHTLVNLDKGLHLFASDDHGLSWYLIDTPIQPADESKIVELVDGSWMVNSRVAKQGCRSVHHSTDQGKSWSTQTDTLLTDPACNASILRYSSVQDGADNNRLIFCNANDKKDRKNLTLRISYDEGKSWTASKTIYAGSSAYSSLCILSNGDIGILFEKDDYQEHVFVRVSLAWLTDGKDKGTHLRQD